MNLAERKFKDVVFTNYISLRSPSTPLYLSLLNGILQGTSADASSRVGNRIYVRGIYLSIYVLGTLPVAANAGGVCQFIVSHNKTGAQGMLTLAEIFQTTNQPNANRNSVYLNKHRLLLNRQHVFVPTSMNGTDIMSGPLCPANIYIPVRKNFQYDASSDPGGTTKYPAGASPAVGAGAENIPNVHLQTGNMAKDDIQFAAWCGVDGCCAMYLSWKVVFTDV